MARLDKAYSPALRLAILLHGNALSAKVRTARKLSVATRFCSSINFASSTELCALGVPMESDLRRSTRVPFIAAAEIVELNTEVRLAAQTGDLSPHGCYMDMVNPLPLGSAVKVRIEHRQQIFSATAGVVYSVPHLGMGLVFRDIEAGKEVTLEKWLTDSATVGA